MLKKSLLFGISALLLYSHSTVQADSQTIKKNQQVSVKTCHGYKRHFRVHIVRKKDDQSHNLKNQQTVALYNNKKGKKIYWSVQDEGNGRVHMNSEEVGEWETFTIEKISGSEGEYIKDGDTIALKSHKKGYLSAQPNGKLEGNRQEIKSWEKFIITIDS